MEKNAFAGRGGGGGVMGFLAFLLMMLLSSSLIRCIMASVAQAQTAGIPVVDAAVNLNASAACIRAPDAPGLPWFSNRTIEEDIQTHLRFQIERSECHSNLPPCASLSLTVAPPLPPIVSLTLAIANRIYRPAHLRLILTE
ncbi:hypothetical protein ACLOJK_017980 [Asimina triloba]